MNISKAGAALAVAALMTVGGAAAPEASPVAAAPVTAAVTGNQLSDQEHVTSVDGKTASNLAFYDRSSNRLTTTLSVSTPYVFYAARVTATTTVYSADWTPLWTVTQSLTACARSDWTCSSDPTRTFQHTPPFWLAGLVHQQAAHVSTSVSVV